MLLTISLFTEIGNRLAQNFNNDDIESVCKNLNCTNESLNFIEIDEDYVIKQLSTLRVDKATGIDGIGARLLRAGAYQIVSPLTYILNLTIRTAVIPLEWKKAVVSPIFKDGGKTNCSNYRPISLFHVITKILERAIHTQVYGH